MSDVYQTIEVPNSPAFGLTVPASYPWILPEELPRNAFTPALAASLVVFSGAGRLLGFTVSSTRASSQFIQVFNATSLPANGAIPLLSVDLATVTSKGIAFDPYGRWFTIGCVIGNSTTQGSLTTGSADCLIDAQYVPQVI